MILAIVDTLQDIINNTKIFVEDTFSFLPSEISVFLITAIGLIIALYVYRLLR